MKFRDFPFSARIKSFIPKIAGLDRLFIIIVAIPTALAICYWGFIASDIYVSHSDFVIRTPGQRTMGSGLGTALSGLLTQPGGDPYTVKDFIKSRDALRQLQNKLGVSSMYDSGQVDFLNRFGGPFHPETDFGALYRYYKDKISVAIDSSSNISTLTVTAFTPRDAYRINERLLGMSEKLVNKLNDRSQQDAIQFAENEVTKAEDKEKKAAFALAQYRNGAGIFDPLRQSALELANVSKLEDELVSARAQLVQIKAVSRENPQIPTLEKGIAAIQREIDAENAKVTGSRRSFSGKSPKYEELLMEQDFAGKEFASALEFLEQARYQAQRQQLYLDRIVQPDVPAAPKPRRLRDIFATLVITLIIWGISKILIAGVLEHMEK